MEKKVVYTRADLEASGGKGAWRTIFNFSALTIACVYISLQLNNPSVMEWMTLAVMMIVGNLGVYLIHRYPLHRYWKWHEFPYREHTIKHHSYFQYHDLNIYSFKEIGNIVFPPQVVLGFVIGYIPVVYFLSSLVFSQNTAWLIVLGSAAYFMLYEIMHTISHAPEDHFLMKVKFLRFMRNHHRLHHHQRLMSKWNFNIVFPLFDWLTGTMITELPPAIAEKEKLREQNKEGANE